MPASQCANVSSSEESDNIDLVSCTDPETCLVAFEGSSWLEESVRISLLGLVVGGTTALLRPHLLQQLFRSK